MFYALDEATGAELWSKDLGAQPALTCPPRGITSSATVAADPSPLRSGIQTVYVAGGDGYLYALDASTGALVWRTLVAPRSETENSYYNWSSPTVVGGGVFLGLASACDAPLVRGGVVRLDQATGAVEGTYWSVPEGSVGGSVWTSVASYDGSSVYASTGNGDEISGHQQGDSRSIVRVNGTTMQRTGVWTVPDDQVGVDSDFGGSPTLFKASVSGRVIRLVAACNKNGVLYAWRANDLAAGPLWQVHIDTGVLSNCLGAPVYDGKALYQGGAETTIKGTTFKGSIRKLDPATGAVVWQKGLRAGVQGSSSLNAGGVLAVPTRDAASGAQNGVYLVSARSGRILRRLDTTAYFAQPVFVDNHLVTAGVTAGLTLWTV